MRNELCCAPKSSTQSWTPSACELVQDRRAPIADIQQRGFGDLEDEQVRIQARTRERLGDRAEQVVGDELPRGEVDRDRERPFTGGLADPLRALAARGLEHRGADGHDQPVVLGDARGTAPVSARRTPGAPSATTLRSRRPHPGRIRRSAGSTTRNSPRSTASRIVARNAASSICCSPEKAIASIVPLPGSPPWYFGIAAG